MGNTRIWLKAYYVLISLYLACGISAVGVANDEMHSTFEVTDIIQIPFQEKQMENVIEVTIRGPYSKISPGTKLKVMRRLDGDKSNKENSTWIRTGTLSVTKHVGDRLLTTPVSEATAESRYFFPHFPGIMIGDQVECENVKIVSHIQIVKKQTIGYHDLFVDPTSFPNSFELSESGKQLLEKLVRKFASLRVPLLLIEGHTDQDGDADVNQIESYQRALTIRQYLIDHLGFDADRLVALGLGETEPISEPYLPDHSRIARRIIIKAKPYASI